MWVSLISYHTILYKETEFSDFGNKTGESLKYFTWTQYYSGFLQNGHNDYMQ